MVPKHIVAATLVLLLCVPYAQAQAQAQARVADATAWRAYAEKLQPNAFVRVRLKDGKSVKGHIVEVGADVLRVNPRTRVAVPLRELAFGEILTIDPQKEPRWNPAVKVLLGVGIGVGTFVLLSVIALAGAYD